MNLLEIASIISLNNAAVIEEMTECCKDPLAYAESRYDSFALRFMGDDLDFIEPETLAWIGLVNCLEENDYVCELDWKEELAEFSRSLWDLHGMTRLSLTYLGLRLDKNWLDPAASIPDWIKVVNARWAKYRCCIAAIDINSDSYVLFPCTMAERDRLKDLAAQLGQRIE